MDQRAATSLSPSPDPSLDGQDRSTKRIVAGVVVGLAFGIATAVGWYLIVWISGTRHPYFMTAVGVTSAYGVWLGSRITGWRSAIMSTLVTAFVLLFACYWVERFLVLHWFDINGDQTPPSIPIVPYFDWLFELFQHTFSSSVLPVVLAIVGLAAAGFFGYHGFERDDDDVRQA